MGDVDTASREFVERTTRRATARAALKKIDNIVGDMERERRRNRQGVLLVTALFVAALAVLGVVYLIR